LQSCRHILLTFTIIRESFFRCVRIKIAPDHNSIHMVVLDSNILNQRCDLPRNAPNDVVSRNFVGLFKNVVFIHTRKQPVCVTRKLSPAQNVTRTRGEQKVFSNHFFFLRFLLNDIQISYFVFQFDLTEREYATWIIDFVRVGSKQSLPPLPAVFK
jgi:hypothetical protein